MSIIFVPLGGYGNRINGLLTCFLLSKLMNRELIIKWNDNNIIFKSNFEEYLSNDIGVFSILNRKEYFTHKPFLCQRLLEEYLPNKKLIVVKCISDISYLLKSNKNYNHILTENFILNNHRSIYFDDNLLLPKNRITNFVDKFCLNNVIGIHIRCGDPYMGYGKEIFIKEDVFNNFIRNFVEILLITFPENKFYICCDYSKIIDIFRHYLSTDKIINIETSNPQKKHYCSKSPDSFDTISEHIILSRCKKIIICENGYISSFSQTAFLISGNDEIYIYRIKSNTIECYNRYSFVSMIEQSYL